MSMVAEVAEATTLVIVVGLRESRLSIAAIKCQHWTLALIPRPSCYVGYYSQTKTKTKREMCVMPKTAGFKNFAF